MKRNKSALAQNIIRLRRLKGWSQLDLAEHADLSVSFIKKIEVDETEGSSVTREKIARALGVTKDDLHAKPGLTLSGLHRPEQQPAQPPAAVPYEELQRAHAAIFDAGKEIGKLESEVARLKAENEDLRRRLAAYETEAPPPDLDPLALMTEAEADAELARLESEVFGSLGKPKPDKA